MTLVVGIAGIGLLGPGLAGWAQGVAVLTGRAPYDPAPLTPPPPTLLPATERRRTGPSVRLALAVAAEAVQDSGLPPEELDTVFASSNGEGQVITGILDALHTPDGAISPTQFHNSVHNAAAGYWGIAVGSSRHDVPLPAPLDALRDTTAPFAVALVLTPGAGARGALRMAMERGAAPLAAMPDALRAMHDANPVARVLPLLAALASGTAATMVLPMLEDARLRIEVTP